MSENKGKDAPKKSEWKPNPNVTMEIQREIAWVPNKKITMMQKDSQDNNAK